jgi:MFS superfamily sulfate permease-like transporter
VRSPSRVLAATVLSFEALVVIFAGLVAKDLSSATPAAALAASGALALACLLCTALLRTRVGYVLGSLLQLAVIAVGLWVPVMFFLGLVFACLWAFALVVGRLRRPEADPRAPTRDGG